RLIDAERSSGAAGVLMTARMEDPFGYGRVVRDAHGRVARIVEQKAGTPEELALREANIGISCFRADLFWKHAGGTRTDNPAGDCARRGVAERRDRAGRHVEAMEIDDARGALGINPRVELAAVDRLFRNRKVEELMLEGVTIERPETVTIDADVRIGM